MSDAITPITISDEGPSEEAAAALQLRPDSSINYAELKPDGSAKYPEVIEYIRQHVSPAVFYARQHRKPLEEEWREIRRMNLLEHDTNQKYKGRAQAYLPIYLRALRTLVSQITRGLFPSDEYMDVTPRLDKVSQDPESGKVIKDYLQYEFEKCAQLRMNIKPHLKQFFNYGWSVMKVTYHKENKGSTKNNKVSLRLVMDKMFGEQERDTTVEGLRVTTRNIFYFYVWPTTVDNLEDATLVFEDVDVPKWYIDEMGKKGKWSNIQKALDAPFSPDHIFNVQQQQIEQMGTSTVPQTSVPGGDLSHWRTLQECWVRIPLPDSAYLPGETKGEPVRCQLILAGDHDAMLVRRQPYWHGRVPYLLNRLAPEPGSFYTKGDGHTAKYLQYLANDTFNQCSDNMTYGLNPVAKVNPSLLAGSLQNFKPGGILLTTDPEHGIIFDRPPVEQVQFGMNFANAIISMLTDTMGSPPILQGQNAGKGARTATSSQILQRNAMNPIQDIVEDFENETLIQLMYMAHSLGQQFREDDLWIPITGAPPQRLSPVQLIGDFNFRWMASSQAANQQQRAMQAMQLLQITPQMMPLLQMLGKTINPEPLLKRIFNDGFGFRGYDQFVVPMQQPMGMPGTPPGQGGQPGAVPAPADTNVETPPNDMVDSEGGDMADVRDGSDEMGSIMSQLGLG